MPKGRLEHILAPGLRILLVAINPAPLSLGLGQHFATPTNAFWKLLHASGLTSRLYRPDEAADLLSEGIGLTSLVSRATRAASELSRAEKEAGALALSRTVERIRPRVVALLGLTLYPFVCPNVPEPGPGPKRARMSGAALFVLPNPSGRNRSYPGFAGKLPWYSALADAFPRDRHEDTARLRAKAT